MTPKSLPEARSLLRGQLAHKTGDWVWIFHQCLTTAGAVEPDYPAGDLGNREI